MPNLYIACEDMDFVWTASEVADFEAMWNTGYSIYEIAEKLKRDPDEVAVLIIDRKRCGCIDDRSGGAWGKSNVR